MATVEKCGTCAFGVKEYHHYSSYTFCHRHAPIVYVGRTGISSNDGYVEETMGPITVWPKVKEDDFCGDWELTDAQS